ncbi:MAG: FKBP-type peptidyl-prolyl cis-trans isomerase [Cyclobacteriaceae bacterium]
MNRIISLSAIIVLIFISGSCLNVEAPCTRKIDNRLLNLVDQPRLQSDIDIIDQYLTANNQNAVKDPSGIRYVILQEGVGETPCLQSIVSASYTGQLLSSGKVFDSSVTPVQFPLANLIVGWQIAFLKFKKGTRAVIYIPSPLGYGATARTNIPANSILTFEINFTDFQ